MLKKLAMHQTILKFKKSNFVFFKYNVLKCLFVSLDYNPLLTVSTPKLCTIWLELIIVNFVCLKTMVFPGRAYLLNDTCLLRTYKVMNGEALKI